MVSKSECDVALEMYQSVIQSDKKEKRLKSTTFWWLFGVRARMPSVVERIAGILDDQGLKFTVKSGDPFGKESVRDWIILSPKLYPPIEAGPPVIPSQLPSQEWFEIMQTRNFESEREVEAFFVSPLLEKLGYEYDDIVIGYPVEMTRGVKKAKTEADIVLFNGVSRSKENALLVVETKKTDKGISVDHIGQARSYAQELLPACYVVSNGQQILVFLFNGTLIPDERVMDFDRAELRNKWGDLYKYISKKATIERKLWIQGQISKMQSNKM